MRLSRFYNWIKRFKWFLILYPFWAILNLLFFNQKSIVTPMANQVFAAFLYIVLIIIIKNIIINIRKDKFNIIFYLSIVFSAFIALSPVIFKSGWPLNHDHLMWKIHTETYVSHICKFDFFPIWSSRDGAGMGAPTPLYYHKIFYYVSSFFYILTTKMKVSILLTIGCFFIIGIFGVYKTSRFFGNNKIISLIISLSFAFLNYSMSNWFLRGAMAEFSAMMILPFFLLEELKLIKYKLYSYKLGALLLLIYLSHSIIGYYSIFTLLFTLLILGFNITIPDAFKILKKLTISAGIIIVFLIAYIIPMYMLSDYFNPSQIKENNAIPQNKFIEFDRYIYDTKYEWFSEPYWNFSVQFDLPILIAIIFIFIIFLIRIKSFIYSTYKIQTISFLLVLNIFFIFLQLKSSGIFYENVPGADFVQFPWRLLSFIQILNIFILLWIISNIDFFKFKKVLYGFSIILLLTLIVFYPPFKGTKYSWFKNNQIEEFALETCNVGEYLPSMYGDNFQFLHEHMYIYKQCGIEIKEKDNYLFITNNTKLQHESNNVKLYAWFKTTSEVIIPITYSNLTRLYKINPITKFKEQLSIYRTDTDPRIRANLPFGEYNLIIELPTLKNIFIPKVKPHNREKFDLIECNTEHQSNFGSYLISNCGFHFFNNSEYRSNEKSRSGEYSTKLVDNNSYGYTYFFNSKKDYSDNWEVSVWRYGMNSNGVLIIQIGDSIFTSQNNASERDTSGWELLKISFKIPPQVSEDDKILFFVFNNNDKTPIYFDDFKIERLEKTNDKWYITNMKNEPISVQFYINAINQDYNWFNIIKKQSEDRNISLDSMIRLNAIWMFENQN